MILLFQHKLLYISLATYFYEIHFNHLCLSLRLSLIPYFYPHDFR